MNNIGSTGVVIHSNVIQKPINTKKLHTACQKPPVFDFIQPAIHLQPTRMHAPKSTDLQKQSNSVNMGYAHQPQPAFDFIQPVIHLKATQMNAPINADLQQQSTQPNAIVDDSSNMYQLVDGSVVSMDQLIVSSGADDEISANETITPTTSNDDASILKNSYEPGQIRSAYGQN